MTTDAFDPTRPLGPRTLIEASAGTGKTYALCGLTAHLVGTGAITVEDLLVVTFTTMATADLKDRIRRRLAEVRAGLADGASGADDEIVVALRSEPDVEVVRDRLDRALADLGGLAVSTIHGFAQRALAAFGSSAGVEAELPILVNDGELLHAAVADELAVHAVTVPPVEGDDRRWIPPVGRVLQVVRELAAVPDIRLEPADAFAVPRYADLVEAHRLAYRAEEQRIEAVVEAETAERGRPVTRERVKELRGEADTFFHEGEVIRAAWLASRAAVRARRARRAAGVRNYTDLLTDLRDALRGEAGAELASQIADRYRVVLIDEFQDTDQVQWEIFDACFGHEGGSRLVVVGDPKQAVYRFRGADVYTYAQVSEDDSVAGRSLGTNYRSDGPLLDALATLFDGVPFGPRADFVAVGANQREARIRWRDPADVDRGGRSLTPLRLAYVAKRSRDAKSHFHTDVVDWIQGLRHGAEIREGRRWRPVNHTDIALLVTMNSDAIELQAQLRDAGIPASIHADDDVRLDRSRAVYDGSSDRFTSPPSEAAWNWRLLLEAMARPSDPTRVRSAITTIFGPEPAAGPEDGSPGARKPGLLALIDDEDALAAFHQEVAGWARTLAVDGVPAFITDLRTRTDWVRRAALQGDDGRLLNDIDQIGQIFVASTGSGPVSVDDLLTVLTATDEDSIEGASEIMARRLASDAPSVQIMTIHKSKGLEFPIVGCFGLSESRSPQKKARTEWAPARHHRRRPGRDGWVEVLDVARGAESLDAEKQEAEDDELRKLYVAFTRAAHHVAAYVHPPDPGKPRGPLSRILFDRDQDGDPILVEGIDGPASRIGQRLGETDGSVEGGGNDDAELLDRIVERSRPSPDEMPTIEWVDLGADSGAGGTGGRGSHGAAEGLEDSDVGAVELEVAEIGPIDRRARRWSFTGLAGAMRADGSDPVTTTGGGRDEGPESTGASDDTITAPAKDPTPPRVSVLQSLRAGAEFGVFVHELLENTDFAVDEVSLGREVEQALEGRRSSLITGPDQSRAQAVEVLVDGLIDAFGAPIGPVGPGGSTLRLRDIARRDRLDECDFDLRLDSARGSGAESTGARLRGLLLDPDRGLEADDPYRPWAEELGRRNFDLELTGFLTGSIDLVYRVVHGDHVRFHIADYKTNRLPAYGPDAVAEAMAAQDYPLQALLYSVGLHRYLRWRLPGYDPETNLGEVTYLFLRGMTAAESGDVVDPPGIARWKIPTSVVLGLDAIFAGREAVIR